MRLLIRDFHRQVQFYHKLGKKNIGEILKEEQNKAFDNLKNKAIKKIGRMQGKIGNQTGTGIKKKKKKTIKTTAISKKKHTSSGHKLGKSGFSLGQQLGKGKKKKKKKNQKQIGTGKKTNKTRKSSPRKKGARVLDILT